MTSDEILNMARDAGLLTVTASKAIGEIRKDRIVNFANLVAKSERTARQAAQLRIEELQAQLVRADAERCKAVSDAMRRMQAGEKLTYTDKEVDLIMLGWQAELDKANAARIEAQTENEALKAKLAKSGLDEWRASGESPANESR